METENSFDTKNKIDAGEYTKSEFDVGEEKPDSTEEQPSKQDSGGDAGREPELTEAEKALIIPHRKLLKVVRYLARSNKAALTAGILTVVVGLLFAIAFMQEHMGQFTVNLNRVDMWRRAISMSETSDFANPTSRLKVNTIKRTTNISIDDIPWDDIEEGDGDKSGKDYIVYSFYIRNGGIEDVDCSVKLNMDYKSKGAENAIRLAVILDGQNTVYAMPAANGEAEPGTTAFQSDKLVMEDVLKGFKVDTAHKYTVVMWIEGDDPECVNDIIGGSVRFSMDFDTGESRDVGLLELIRNLPLFRGAVQDDGLGSKYDREGLWDEESGIIDQNTVPDQNAQQGAGNN